jgi:deoxyribonuclease-1-like protein
MRSIPFYPLMVILLVGLGGYLGCDPNAIPNQAASPGFPTSTSAPAVGSSLPVANNPANQSTIPARTVNTILVGSFNMQRLGPSKLANGWTMERFAEIIRQYDVIALQEITSEDQRTLPILVDQVNQAGRSYGFTISTRIGRQSTGYYEQYAFVFDRSRVQTQPDMCYVVKDDGDYLHREPFVGRFQTITTAGQPFRFTMINIHTDPDEIKTELNVLADVYRSVREYEYPEDDIILLGDLNATPTGLQALGQIPDLVPIIQNVFTNTRQSKTIDNILVDRQNTREFTGRAGSFSLEKAFRIQMKDAEKISDHLPIWAEFSIVEQSPTSVMMGNTNGSMVR